MILLLIFLAAIGLILLAERSLEHLAFAVAAFCLSTAVLLLVVADFDRAILLAGLLAAAITAASTVKYNHSALKLIVTDLPLLFAGTVPFFIVQYPRAVLAALSGAAALALAVGATLVYGDGPPVDLAVRVSLFGLALIAHRHGLEERRRRLVPAHQCAAAMLLLGLHGLADRSSFAAAIPRIGAERYRR